MSSLTLPRRHAVGYAGYTEAARWIVLVALMLGTVLEMLDVSIVNVAIPAMMGNLGATIDQVSWVSTGYIIANVIVLPLSGWLSAYLGRRRYLAGSVLVFTAASFLCGNAHSLGALVLFRIVQGAGGAALLSTAMAALLEIFPEERHGLVAAVFGLGVMAGPTLGPALGGWITDNYSWPWIFYINIPIGIPAAALVLLFMVDREDPNARRSPVDALGILLLAVGVGSLQVVLERGNREGWFGSALICWLAAASVAGLVAFVVWELHTPYPAVNLRVLRNRGLAAATVFSAAVGFGIYGSLFILPVFLQQVRGYTALQTGRMLVVDGAAAAVSMAIVGKLVTRVDSRVLVAAGAVSFATSMLLLRTITLDTGPAQLYLPYVLRGASLGFLFVPLSLAALAGLRGQEMADGSGLFNLTRQWGGSVGIAFLSTLLDHRVALHRARIAEHISVYDPAVQQRLAVMRRYLVVRGSAPTVAGKQAMMASDLMVQAQAAVLAFADAFIAVGIALLVAIPLLLLFRRARAEADATALPHA